MREKHTPGPSNPIDQQNEEIRDLASLVAEIIRRMGAAYGSAEDWREGFTVAVKILESASTRSALSRSTARKEKFNPRAYDGDPKQPYPTEEE